MGKIIDLVGQKFGRLIIIKLSNERVHNRISWECLCECGNKCIKTGHDLKQGAVKSCGCLLKETSSKRMVKHGFRHNRFYNILVNAKTRCNNPNCKEFKRYGARGIKICKKWMQFENFRDDMYESYLEHCKKFGIKETTLDRIDNSKGYSKENCRWATYKEQANNRTYLKDRK